ncbi:MAG: putative electron transport protein, partial [uncultured Nocardioides sp.]
GRGRAGGVSTAPGGDVLLLARTPVGGDLRHRGDRPRVVGLSQVRPAGQHGLGEPAARAEDRAVQDPPRLREGAPLRRRGGRHPRRGHPAAEVAPQVRRDHLL